MFEMILNDVYDDVPTPKMAANESHIGKKLTELPLSTIMARVTVLPEI